MGGRRGGCDRAGEMLDSEKEEAVKEDCEDETIYRAGRACALPAQRNGDGG